MEVKARLKHLKVAPRKVRLLANLIKGLNIIEAEKQLMYTNKGVTTDLLKLLRSGVANAINNFDLDRKTLTVKNVLVDEGFTLKRWMPRAMGRATMIRKRSSHVTLIIEGKRKADKVKKENKIVKNKTDNKKVENKTDKKATKK